MDLALILKQIEAGEYAYIDSETCGLYGMPVLLQFGIDDGEIHLFDIWLHPVKYSLAIIEKLLDKCCVFFNASFDMFHMIKLYTIFRLCDPEWIPVDHIEEIAALEPEGRDGPCLKPRSTIDLMLHARKGPYQSLMARSDIRIRRVPIQLADALSVELENRIHIDDIYFARAKDKDSPKWHVMDVKNRDGKISRDFKDVVLKFKAAGGLKYLAEHALHLKPKFHFKDVEVDSEHLPKELGYAPLAKMVSRAERNWEVYKMEDGKRRIIGHAWPGKIKHHIHHWATNANAREYAKDDIVYTRGLHIHFGKPTPDDDDSVLACMVAAVRWKGFKLDLKGMRRMLRASQAVVNASPVNVNKAPAVREYLGEMLDDIEQMIISESTKKQNIELIAKWRMEKDEDGYECSKCDGKGCKRCDGKGQLFAIEAWEDCERCNNGCEYCQNGKVFNRYHPAAYRATDIIKVKLAQKEVELYKKLLKAGRFHASFKVIGTLSSRMSGADGLNPQGVKRDNEVRKLFVLAWENMILSGGDFDSFEVVLADAVWGDENLRSDLMNGKKIHALFAMDLFPKFSYEEILASSGTDNDMYTKGKTGVFGTIYGGDEGTLVRNTGVSLEVAQNAFVRLSRRYPQMAASRQRTSDMFCSMEQKIEGGPIIYKEPQDCVTSFLGFSRFFTLENMVCKALFDLAQRVPSEWRKLKIKVLRRDREQTASGAVSSALYGAAFGIQASNQRAAGNHEIQSPGAQITKNVQRRVWDLQPCGIHEFHVIPMNIHDELLVVNRPDLVEQVTQKVQEGVESYRDKVPLIGMTWNELMDSWAEKKGASKTVKITWKKEAN